MLKLLKYEWKACARACFPVYLAALLLALVNRLFNTGGLLARLKDLPLFGMLQAIAGIVYGGVFAAVFIVTTVILIQRFYKNLLGDEGYLMFTLPVTPAQHIWSKVIIGCVMSAISMVAALLSMWILVSGAGLFGELGRVLQEIFDMIRREPSGVAYGLETMLFCVILAVAGVLFCYLCMAMGHLAKKHRVLMSVVWFFVLSTVAQIVLVMAVYMLDGTPLYDMLYNMTRNWSPQFSIHMMMLALCVGAAIPAAISFFGTNYILKNKLNLE